MELECILRSLWSFPLSPWKAVNMANSTCCQRTQQQPALMICCQLDCDFNLDASNCQAQECLTSTFATSGKHKQTKKCILIYFKRITDCKFHLIKTSLKAGNYNQWNAWRWMDSLHPVAETTMSNFLPAISTVLQCMRRKGTNQIYWDTVQYCNEHFHKMLILM